jgi:hypothetical protein
LTVSIYVSEAVASLEPSEDELLNAVTSAIVVEEAFEAVSRVLSQGYGRKIVTDTERFLFQDLARMRAPNYETFSGLAQQAASQAHSGEKSLAGLPHVHSTFVEDVTNLVATMNTLSKNTKNRDLYAVGLDASRLWSSAVTLWRATYSQDTELPTAHHEWVLATRRCTQTCALVRNDIAVAKALSQMKKGKLSNDKIPDVTTQNPLNVRPPKQTTVSRRTPKEETESS